MVLVNRIGNVVSGVWFQASVFSGIRRKRLDIGNIRFRNRSSVRNPG